MTVFRHPRFQFVHTIRQHPHVLAQQGIFGFQLGQAFRNRHGPMLHYTATLAELSRQFL